MTFSKVVKRERYSLRLADLWKSSRKRLAYRVDYKRKKEENKIAEKRIAVSVVEKQAK